MTFAFCSRSLCLDSRPDDAKGRPSRISRTVVDLSAGSDEGCNGGLMDNAFEFIIKMGGITSEEAYPYISGNGTTGTCVARLMKKKVAHITDYCDVTPNNETDLELAVNQQVQFLPLCHVFHHLRPRLVECLVLPLVRVPLHACARCVHALADAGSFSETDGGFFGHIRSPSL